MIRVEFTEETLADLSSKDKYEFLRERRKVRMLDSKQQTEANGKGYAMLCRRAGSVTRPVWKMGTGKRPTVQ